jgi:hypothetical protein
LGDAFFWTPCRVLCKAEQESSKHRCEATADSSKNLSIAELTAPNAKLCGTASPGLVGGDKLSSKKTPPPAPAAKAGCLVV